MENGTCFVSNKRHTRAFDRAGKKKEQSNDLAPFAIEHPGKKLQPCTHCIQGSIALCFFAGFPLDIRDNLCARQWKTATDLILSISHVGISVFAKGIYTG
jgi:hypothetical protein